MSRKKEKLWADSTDEEILEDFDMAINWKDASNDDIIDDIRRGVENVKAGKMTENIIIGRKYPDETDKEFIERIAKMHGLK